MSFIWPRMLALLVLLPAAIVGYIRAGQATQRSRSPRLRRGASPPAAAQASAAGHDTFLPFCSWPRWPSWSSHWPARR